MAQRSVAEALSWYNREATSPPFDPDGMCLKVCRTARNIGSMYPSAVKAQNATPARHRISRIRDIKPGHIMYFDTVGDSNPYGHIVTVVGRVKGVDVDSLSSIVVWTNSVKANQLVKVRADYFPRYWGDRFVFAADWLNGVKLDMGAVVAPPPAPVVKTPKGYMQLRIAHASLQYSDTTPQRRADIDKIFAQGFHWITGTEAGEKSTRILLAEAAQKFKHKYRVHVVRDTWVAVRNDMVQDGTWRVGQRKFVDNDLTAGKGHDSGIAFVTFVNPRLGKISIASSHYATRGTPVKGDPRKVNLKWNKIIAAGIDKWADEYGEGAGLVWYGGDQNIDDKKADTFFGHGLTSCWDDLKRYPGTHGGGATIDVIARRDEDTRIKPCFAADSKTDKEFFLSGDHLLVVAKYNVKER